MIDLLAEFRWIKTPDDASRALDAMGGDAETAHIGADRILLAFLDVDQPEISAAWRRVQDRCDGFYYS